MQGHIIDGQNCIPKSYTMQGFIVKYRHYARNWNVNKTTLYQGLHCAKPPCARTYCRIRMPPYLYACKKILVVHILKQEFYF